MPRNVTKLKLTAALVSGVVLLGGLSACGRDESTATLLAEAKQYQQKGDQKAALIQLKNAVAKSPEDGAARLQLGTLYLDMGDAVSADKEIRKAASLGIGADQTTPLLARALHAQGQFQKLLDEIKPEQAKSSAPLLALRGDAALALGDAAKSREAYEQALAVNPNSGDAMLGLARHAMIQKDNEGAHRQLAQAEAKDGKNADVFMFKGALLRAEGKPDQALTAFDQALALQPGHRSAHIEKAYILIAQGKFDAAKTEVDAARKATPGNLIVTYTQAMLDFSQGKHAAAFENLQKVLRVAPEHMPTILLSGAVELNMGSLQQAEQHLRKYLEANPNNVYARKLLAQVLLKNAQPADAATALAPALKEPTQDAQLLALAGESYMQSRDFNKATGYFEKASALAPQAASIRTSLGLSKLGQGDRDQAVSELERATTLDPKSLAAGMALVQTELGLKHYDKALAAVQKLEQQQPSSAQVQNLKGGVYLGKGDAAAARASFEKAVALEPTFIAPVANLAQLDLQQKQPDAARKRFQAVLDKDTKNIEAMNALAAIELSQGRPEQATTWLEKASADHPDAVSPALKLGAHYLRIKQPQKALALVRKHQAANPANPDLLDLLGQSQLANNDQAGALESYSKLVNVLPKSPLAQVRLAAVHMLMKNLPAAEDDLKRAVNLDPNFMQARVAQVELAMRRNKPDEAIAIARQIQKQNDKATIGYMLEGDLQITKKQPVLALAAYEKAYAIAKTPDLLLKTAELQKRTGKANEAERRLAQWTRDNPTEPMVPLYLAEIDMAKKQYKPAADRLEAVIKNQPKNAYALNNLAWAYQQLNDPRALPTAELAAQLAGDNPAIMDTLGWILVQQGKVDRAVPLLRKALAGAPQSAEIRYHLAAALAKSGDKANARKELEQALASTAPFSQRDEANALLKQL
jgi:putative PEP-CTERM system TPR-repeat lipoprotein